MSDTYKIKAVLDTDDVKRGAREIERELSQMGSGANALPQTSQDELSLNTKATEAIAARTTATEKLAEATRKLSTERKTAMILGGGVAAAELTGSFMKAGGMETGADMLTGAARSAARVGTMLAPLGPQAAIIGAAAGGIAGAVGSLVESMGAAQKALTEQAAKAKRDAEELRRVSNKNRADEIVSRKQFEELAKTDPEAAKTFLAGIRKELDEAMVYAKQGAPVEQDLRKAALYYPKETEAVIKAGWNKGELTREQKDLGLAINAKSIEDQKRRAAESESWSTWNRLSDLQDNLFKKFPELMGRDVRARYGGDKSISRVEDIEKGGLFATGELAPKGGRGGGVGSVDAFQNIGMGVYSNPMKRSEEILQSIDGKLTVISRKPAGSTLL